MATTTFNGPVRSENGFQSITTDAAGTVTSGAALTRIRTASAALNFPSIPAVSQADLTITVAGAAINDNVVLGLPAAPTAGITFNAFVSAANTVTIRASNITAGAIDPVSMTYNVLVLGATN